METGIKALEFPSVDHQNPISKLLLSNKHHLQPHQNSHLKKDQLNQNFAANMLVKTFFTIFASLAMTATALPAAAAVPESAVRLP